MVAADEVVDVADLVRDHHGVDMIDVMIAVVVVVAAVTVVVDAADDHIELNGQCW